LKNKGKDSLINSEKTMSLSVRSHMAKVTKVTPKKRAVIPSVISTEDLMPKGNT